jgi:hypothetical protein
MVEIKRRSDMPQSDAERIQKRLRNSGVGEGSQLKPDVTVTTGNGPQRTIHNLHRSAGHRPLPVQPVNKGESR